MENSLLTLNKIDPSRDDPDTLFIRNSKMMMGSLEVTLKKIFNPSATKHQE